MTSLLKLDDLRQAPLVADPFPFFAVDRAIADDVVQAVIRDFPDIPDGGSFNRDDAPGGPQFNRLLESLDTPEFRRILCDKFGKDVMELPMMITLRGYSREKDGRIHTDSKTKVLTVLIYLNEAWTAPTGRLRILRNSTDLNDYVAEIEPGPGSLVAFDVTDNCWHGYLPFEGKRQSIQINFLTGNAASGKHRFFHGLSAKLKKLRRRARSM